ncbi:MAG: ImmA/IrrE family metallo-endopeptidase [Rhabdochlamydiaceae bacterium]|jgi:Zn-dependent peptidase ImmA (M78 family)
MVLIKDPHVAKGRAAAEKALRDNFIESPPVIIHELVENYGLTVFKATFDDKEIAGYIDFDKKWIVVNNEEAVARQNFSIAHELGHWIMHPDEVKADQNNIRIVYRRPMGGETEPLEIEANAFAAYLLVPEEMLKRYHEKSDLELAQLFNVSQSLIGFRRINSRA